MLSFCYQIEPWCLSNTLFMRVRRFFCQVVSRIILNRQTFLSCLFLFFLSFFLSVPEPKGDYHHPPVSCTTIYKLLKTSRLHNAISVRYTEPKNRLKKCEILSICRKIRLFWRCLLLFFGSFSWLFAGFSCFLFYGQESKKTRAMLLHIALGFQNWKGPVSLFFFIFFRLLRAEKFCPFGIKLVEPKHFLYSNSQSLMWFWFVLNHFLYCLVLKIVVFPHIIFRFTHF